MDAEGVDCLMRPPRLKLGLRFKITAYISFIVIITAAVLGWFLVRQQVQEISAHLKEKGAVLGRNVASASEYGVLTGNTSMFDSIIAGLSKEKDVAYCIIYNNRGEILARTPKLPHHIEGISPAAAYEMNEWARNVTSLDIRSYTRDETRTPVFDVAAPIMTQRTPFLSGEEVIFAVGEQGRAEGVPERIGVARVGISLDSMNKEIHQARRTILTVTVMVVLLAIGVTVFLVRVIVNPVQQLVNATERVASGNLDHLVSINTNDEIGDLGASFNKMTRDLKRYRTELEDYSRTLEQKVEERTKALRLMNEELQRTNQQIEAVSKLKSEFLANMSHELRTPLNAIIGFSEILCDQSFGGLNEKQIKYAQNVVVSGKHLLQLINEILDLAKVESGKMSVNVETFPVRGVLAEIANFARGLAAKKEIAVRERFSPKLVTVTADPKKFKQIFYNLLSNAIKFTPAGGWVEVTTDIIGDFEIADGDQVVLKRYAEFCVRDTGIGVDKADHERIFQEFQQVDGSYSRQYEGTGLGLALTKKLVELHHGSIWIESEKGKGAAFYFTIPLTDKDITEQRKPAIAADDGALLGKAGGQEIKETILVVEDDPHSFELISTYLEGAGYNVVHARTGEEALKMAHSAHPAFIALDIILPDIDGWKILQELKSSGTTRDIPVIITSVLQDEETGFSMGAADYIVKPVSGRELLSRLERLRETTVHGQIANVLVVDDDEKFVDLLASMLDGQSFVIDRAYTGLQAIEHASRRKPDLIFLDLILPDMSGFEVVEFLKMEAGTKDIPIIIVTAKDLTEQEKQSLNGKIEAIAKKGQYGKDDFLDEVKRVERLVRTRKEEV
jgi:signal transduction histidine kinase/DNA-binding response OmpR family regulator